MKARRATFVRWFVLLAGPLAWAGHFLFVYGVASLELTLTWTAGWVSRLAIGVATVGAVAFVLLLMRAVQKGRLPHWGSGDDHLRVFWRYVTVALCLLSAIAILWQALPALVIPVGTSSHDSDLFRSQRE